MDSDNSFYNLNIECKTELSEKEGLYRDFIFELNCLDYQLNTYLEYEETAKTFNKKLFSEATRKIKDRKNVKFPKYILELFPFDYWVYHLFNGHNTVEFHFENPLEEIKSVLINKSKIRNVEFLTLFIHRPDTLLHSSLPAGLV